MSEFAQQNVSVRYFMFIIDVFSKFAYVVPLKSKSASDFLDGSKSTFNGVTSKPASLRCDKGSVFVNKLFSDS